MTTESLAALWGWRSSPEARAFAIYIVGGSIMAFLGLFELPTSSTFFLLYIATVALCPPRYAFSPLTVFYGYYGLWFVAAPNVAGIYDGVLGRPEYRQAFIYAYLVFGLGPVMLGAGEKIGAAARLPILSADSTPPSTRTLTLLICALFAISTLFVWLIVNFSGGIATWVADPGQAFLMRHGTGAYVIASHFASIALAAACAYAGLRSRSAIPVVLFLAWLTITSPVHGSKFQISLLFVIAVLPWIYRARLTSAVSLALGGAALLIFFAGMQLRSTASVVSWQALVSIGNYFTALHNLAVSIRDFEPGFFETFFLPFNKVWMTIGVIPKGSYFDMNHMLTAIYRPDAWAIGATEQWPVETDLYLNFHFYLGLPVVAAFLFACGAIYGYARTAQNTGAWLAAAIVALGLISHLRGSIYNHVDFYMYPYTAMMFFWMHSWAWNDGNR